MSEAEFDSYLSLLSKFLRLRSRQRAELADELRDHLDSRLEELLAAGKTREQAIAVALEEFGDAAVLATEFSRLASRRTRRFVMRCTAASAAVVAAVLLLSVALAPPGPNGAGPEQVVAQDNAASAETNPGGPSGLGGVPAVPDKTSIEQQAVAALDEKLAQPVKVEFDGMPLRAVIESIANEIEADVLFAEAELVDHGVGVEEPVTLKLTRTPLAAQTVLGFVLEPLELAFVNRSGVIYITTPDLADELLVTRVYNIRDVIENATTHAVMEWSGGGLGGGFGGGGFFSVADAAAVGLAGIGQIGGGLGGGSESAGDATAQDGAGSSGGMGSQAAWNRRVIGPAAELIHTIHETTSGPWQEKDGAGGSLTIFNGLLVVRQTEQVHAEIQKLLDALREAGRREPGGSVTVPKGGGPVGSSDPAAGMPTLPPGDGSHSPGEEPATASIGLGARFAEYRPTPEMRQMFLGAVNQSGFSTGEIGELAMFEALLTVEGPAKQVFYQYGISSDDVRVQIRRNLVEQRSFDLYAVLDAAQADAKKASIETFDTGHLLVVLLEKGKDGPLRELLAQLGLGVEQVKDGLKEYRKAASPQERHPLQREPRDAAADNPAGDDQANFYSPLQEISLEWPALGLRMTAVQNPQWFVGEKLTHAWTPFGLRVDQAPMGDSAGLRKGDVIVSWSADSWSASPDDPETMSFDGRRIPSPERITHAVARAHRATSIIFSVIRMQGGLPRPAKAQMPIGGA